MLPPARCLARRMPHTKFLRDLLSTGRSRGAALVQLRDSGVSPVACVKALNEIRRLEPPDAKRLVDRLRSTPSGVPFWEELDEILTAVCRIPEDLHQYPHVSEVELLRASGYVECADRILESAIAERFARSSQLLDSWLTYSCDQRATPSWYLNSIEEKNGPGAQWVVGWMPRSGPKPSEEVFANRVSATAAFAKRTLECLALHSEAG